MEEQPVLPFGLETVAQGSIQIDQKKLERFDLGLIKKSALQRKKESEEERQKTDDIATEAVYQEFITSFGDAADEEHKEHTKTSVRKTIMPKSTTTPPSKKQKLTTESFFELDDDDEQDVFRVAEIKAREKKKMKIDTFLKEIKSKEVSVSADETSLFIMGLAPSVTDDSLAVECRKFGTVRTVVIIQPRTDIERRRGYNNGFVIYNVHSDACKAIEGLNGKFIDDMKLTVEWGTPPPVIAAAVDGKPVSQIDVTFPSNSDLITKLAKSVVSSGWEVESIVRARVDKNDKRYAFLFNFGSSEDIFYRWRIYSLLNGDSEYSWRTDPFQMFTNGPFWNPPKQPVHKPLPIPLLSMSDKRRFEELLYSLTQGRDDILMLMGFAIDHAEAAEEVVKLLMKVIEDPDEVKNPLSQVARLYVVSDILHNTSLPKQHVTSYRTLFESCLPRIFSALGNAQRLIEGRMSAQKMRDQVFTVIKIWRSWSFFLPEFVEGLMKNFDGIIAVEFVDDEEEDIDGVPIE